VDSPGAAPLGPVIDLDGQGVGQEAEIGRLGALRFGREAAGVETDAGQPQLTGGCLDRCQRRGIGGHRAASSSWS
jgi:hypothetical protein